MPAFANRKIIVRRDRYYAHSIYAPHAADYEVITGSDLADHADSLGRWERDDSGRAVWVEPSLAETVASVLRNVGTTDGPYGAGNWFSDPDGPRLIGPCEEPDCGCEGEYECTDAFLHRFAPAEIRSIASALTLRERRCERN